jgi:hypothetical protein
LILRLLILVISDSKTETSKEILLKGFSEEDFQFQISNYNTSLDGGDERAILERRDSRSSGKPVLGNDKLL